MTIQDIKAQDEIKYNSLLNTYYNGLPRHMKRKVTNPDFKFSKLAKAVLFQKKEDEQE